MDPAFILVLTLLVLGYAMARLGVFVDAAADVLNRYVIYVCLPALVLRLIPKLELNSEGLWLPMLMPWAMLVVSVALVLIAARLFAWPRPIVGALLLCAPLGNTSFLGFPFIIALRGESAVRYALLYDQFGSFLILSTYGLWILSRYSGQVAPSLGQIARRIGTFPPFLALLVALIPWARPPWVDPLLQAIDASLAPLAVFAVGLRLRLRPPPHRAALVIGLAIKLVLGPAIAWLIIIAFGNRSLAAQVAVLEAGMPSMISAGALASMAGLAPELCAAWVGYGVFLSLVTLPLWSQLLL